MLNQPQTHPLHLDFTSTKNQAPGLRNEEASFMDTPKLGAVSIHISETKPIAISETKTIGIMESDPIHIIGISDAKPIGINEREPYIVGISETKPIDINETELTQMDIKAMDLTSSGMKPNSIEYESMSSTESLRTMVLLGKTGNGKSATANSILGRKAFVSKMSMGGVTTDCEKHENDEQTIEIIDTPGLFDSSVGRKEISEEIVKCLSLAPNGIHSFLVVVSGRNRFSEEEEGAIYCLQKIFGSKIFEYVIVVFTCGDSINEDGKDDDECLNKHLRTGSGAPKNLLDILKLCCERKVLFNNHTVDESNKSRQVNKLLCLVDQVLTANGGEPYTYKLFGKEGTIRMHGKDDGYRADIEYIKEEIQKKYDEQLKKSTAEMELKYEELVKILREDKEMASEEVAKLKAELDSMAKQLDERHEMLIACSKRAETEKERAEQLSKDLRDSQNKKGWCAIM